MTECQDCGHVASYYCTGCQTVLPSPRHISEAGVTVTSFVQNTEDGKWREKRMEFCRTCWATLMELAKHLPKVNA